MEDSTNKTQAKTTWKSMLIKKKKSISEKVSLSLEMLIGNAKKKILCFKKNRLNWHCYVNLSN